MELILLLALVALAVAHVRLAGRTAALEREVEHLWGGAPAAGAAAFEPSPPTAAAVAAPPAVAAAEARREAPGEERAAWVGPAVPEAAARPRENLGGLFERYVGGRLLIWIGGIALAVAGV